VHTVSIGGHVAGGIESLSVAAGIESSLPARGDDVDHQASQKAAENLDDPVRQQCLPLDPLSDGRAEGDGGIEVTTRHRAERVHPGEHRQAEGQRNPRNPMPTGTPSETNLAVNTALPQPPSTSQNVPNNSAAKRCAILGAVIIDLSPSPLCPKADTTAFPPE
jgi:hypothetical protein